MDLLNANLSWLKFDVEYWTKISVQAAVKRVKLPENVPAKLHNVATLELRYWTTQEI